MWRRLYAWVVHAAGRPQAPWWLAALAFAESSFFPIPPDVMLAPMVLARRQRAWRYAAIATLGSIAGGVFGYALGALFIDTLVPWLQELGYHAAYDMARGWFTAYGFWAILLAGFSPIPYKVFTIAAGTMAMPLGLFVLASAAGRGARFFLVAGLARWLGPVFEQHLLKYLDWIGWITLALVAAALLVYQLA